MTQSGATIVVLQRAKPLQKPRTRGRRAAWIVSLAVHAAILTSLGITIPHLPQGGAGGGTGSSDGGSGIVLTAQFGQMSPSYLREAITNRIELVSTAPALLAIPTLPLPMPANQPRQPEIALANAKTAIPNQRSATPPTAGSMSPGIADGGRGQTQLFGVPGHGTRFVYVFDRSASMEGVRLAAAKQELITSIFALESRHQFQVIYYSQRPEAMPLVRGSMNSMFAADERSKLQAATFIRGILADGPTHHPPALELALRLQPDVIFFLTDADEPQMSTAELAQLRRLNRGTVINTIEFGAGLQPANYNFLQQLAAENHGQHAYVDLSRLVR